MCPHWSGKALKLLTDLLTGLSQELVREVFTHASWTEQRSESYERLAFLGDSVLALSITDYLYPRLDPLTNGAGQLTKIRAQVVCGRSCRAVAERLEVPEKLAKQVPPEFASSLPDLCSAERVLASVTEAVIGACYLTYGYKPTAEAVAEAFQPEIEEALKRPDDFKSMLQETLARRHNAVAVYRVLSEEGPPHKRVFEIAVFSNGQELGRGLGRSKKEAEQVAAGEAIVTLGVL